MLKHSVGKKVECYLLVANLSTMFRSLLCSIGVAMSRSDVMPFSANSVTQNVYIYLE